MMIQDGYAADTTAGGGVIYEQVFTAICYPDCGIQSEGTLVYPNEPSVKPKRTKQKKEGNNQLTLF